MDKGGHEDMVGSDGKKRKIHVKVNQKMIHDFLKIAKPNSTSKTETCGFLVGKKNDSTTTCFGIIIPKQTGTNHSCIESEIGTEQRGQLMIEHELFPIGWIHTHPHPHGLFLSSIDMHMQYAEQSANPDSVAIVVSYQNPDVPSIGVFQLTEKGMEEIEFCNATGGSTSTHHLHDSPNLYVKSALHSSPDLKYKVWDLRE
eukprot:TRINITY_DN1623_c0_g1_i1.p1 TRINITY_DN1623_c0_g1~~TRINITY_DN1623_c0_g1_i1.p1  ORF type:complete len:200 (+),score=27.28 TRINITY_DN1623_c0_g1_i1:152-751(+)